MPDVKEVINGLEMSYKYSNVDENNTLVPQWIVLHAIALLKVQEPPTSESISSAIECLLHPQDADDSDMAKAIDTAVRAMRLMNAQEPVEPKLDVDEWKCGKCGHKLEHQELIGDNVLLHEQYNYCPECGRAVKWE
jgi:hypothetical protein